jgi:hypothetical protein
MMKLRATLLILPFALASSLRAQGADFQVCKARNDTPFPVACAFRWGAGLRDVRLLGPGEDVTLYSSQILGPIPLFVDFDVDPGPGINVCQYRLRTYTSPTTLLIGPPTEVFVILPDGRIDIRNTRL